MNAPALSIAIGGLDPDAAPTDPKGAIRWAAAHRPRAVHLNAAMPGLRPRELTRADRRELAATLRRLDVAASGLDLWIPPAHFDDPARADRALAAAEAAAVLAADLAALAPGSSPVVCVELPPEPTPGLIATLAAAADRVGVRFADHARTAAHPEHAAVSAGLDPADLLARGADPVASAGAAGRDLASARLCDADRVGRGPVGRGRLDTAAYAATLALAGLPYAVVDLRGLKDPAAGVAAARDAWAPIPAAG